MIIGEIKTFRPSLELKDGSTFNSSHPVWTLGWQDMIAGDHNRTMIGVKRLLQEDMSDRRWPLMISKLISHSRFAGDWWVSSGENIDWKLRSKIYSEFAPIRNMRLPVRDALWFDIHATHKASKHEPR